MRLQQSYILYTSKPKGDQVNQTEIVPYGGTVLVGYSLSGCFWGPNGREAALSVRGSTDSPCRNPVDRLPTLTLLTLRTVVGPVAIGIGNLFGILLEGASEGV